MLNGAPASGSSAHEKRPHMNKHATTGKRVLKGDVWHDDNGPIPGTPADWQPPMTDAEIIAAALSDPDNPPLTGAQLERMQPVSEVKRLRWSMRLSQAEFASQFGIPLGTLRDWEQRKSEPDAAARVLLRVIRISPQTVAEAVKVA